MIRTALRPPCLALLLAVACEKQSVAPTASPEPQQPMPAAQAQTATAGGETPTTVADKQPTPDPAQEQAKQLTRANQELEAETAKEATRWTPELHEQTKTLVSKKHGTMKKALRAALESNHRKPGHAERDQYRHPIETMEFFGLKPTMTVVELGPGTGWWTEILAVVLYQKGKLVVPTMDPHSQDPMAAWFGKATAALLDKSPELFGKVERVINVDMDPKKMKFGEPESADMVLVMRHLHNWHRNKSLADYLAASYVVLKPGGVLAVEQHRAHPDANPDESAPKGYMPEAWVIQQVEAAGFQLAGKSDINANAKDTKDHPAGVWSLPPSYALGDKDREKYSSIGESDRMTLKFVKPKNAGKAKAREKPAAEPKPKP